MVKKLNVIIDNKERTITYEKTGNRYDVKAEDNEIQKYLPSSFFTNANGYVEFLSINDRAEKIMNVIVKQIDEHEKL